MLKSASMSQNDDQPLRSQTAGLRTALAIFLPLGAAILTSLLLTNLVEINNLSSQATSAVLLSTMAVVAWLLGLRWYGLSGLGLRGKRPLYASIGFAVLGWVILLIARIFFVQILTLGPPNSARTYFYLLLFEAFATQIWTYGLLFRAISDWRGPLTAAFASGIFFGLIGILLFQESFVGSQFSIIYFITWGVLYGFIRLRTGSLLGTVLVQSLQTFSTWVALTPNPQPDPQQLQNMYTAVSIAYAIVIWRLWPKNEEDYRV